MIESVNVQVSDVASLLINLMFIKLYYSHNFISLQWLVVMSSPVVFSGLSANSKRVYSRLAVWAVATVGFAIQERKTMPSQELHSVSLSEFNALLDRCDVVILCQEGGFRCDVPLPEEIAHIKRLVKEFYNMNTEKVSNTKTLYYVIIAMKLTLGKCFVGMEEMDRDETSVS